MRTIDSGIRAQLSAVGVNHHLRVEVANGSGTMIDLTDLEGVNWVETAEWGEDVDTPVGTFSIGLSRDTTHVDTLSASPTWGATPLNRDDAAAYSPLLYPGRNCVIYCCATAPGVAPLTGDWRECFNGRIDSVDWHSPQIVITGRDQAAYLINFFVPTEDPLVGLAPGAVDIEDVLQATLDEYGFGAAGLTVYTPTSPGYAFANPSEEPQVKQSIWESMQNMALLIGWSLRFRYDASDDNRLTFYDPDRTRTTVDATFGPGEYQDVTALEVNDFDVRNTIRVKGFDATGEAIEAYVFDLDSGLAFGSRYMEINLAEGDQLDTEAELEVLAEAALADLKDPLATHEIKTLLFWPVQLGDRYTYQANADHYDDDQTLATTAYRHRFENGEGWTTIQARGTVAGQYHAWIRKGIKRVRPNLIPGTDALRPGSVEIIENQLVDLGFPGVAPPWAFVAQALSFKLNQYTDYTGDTTAPKSLGANKTQALASSLSGGDLPLPVTLTVTGVDGVSTDYRPAYDNTTKIFSYSRGCTAETMSSFRITAEGNTYTTSFEHQVTAPAPMASLGMGNLGTEMAAVSFLSAGLVGDGVNDDTTALNFALSVAEAADCILDCGDMVFKVTGPITVGGPGIHFDQVPHGDAGGPGILVSGTGYTAVTITGSPKKLNFTVYGTGNTANGVLLQNPLLAHGQDIRVFKLDGFGVKINKCWDCTFNSISVEQCGNTSQYAFSMNDDGDTCNETHIARLQVEKATAKAIFISGSTLQCKFDVIHSEQATPNASYDTWFLGGSRCHYDVVRLVAASSASSATCKLASGNTTYTNLMTEGAIDVSCDPGSSGSNCVLINPEIQGTFHRLSGAAGFIETHGGVINSLYDPHANGGAGGGAETWGERYFGTHFTSATIGFQTAYDPKLTLFTGCKIDALVGESTHSAATFTNCDVTECNDLMKGETVINGGVFASATAIAHSSGMMRLNHCRINAAITYTNAASIRGKGCELNGAISCGDGGFSDVIFDSGCVLLVSSGSGQIGIPTAGAHYNGMRHHLLLPSVGSPHMWVRSSGTPGTVGTWTPSPNL